MDESPKPSDKLSEIKDNDQSKDDTNMEQQEAQKEEDQLPDFEEEESDKEEFEMIQKCTYNFISKRISIMFQLTFRRRPMSTMKSKKQKRVKNLKHKNRFHRLRRQ